MQEEKVRSHLSLPGPERPGEDDWECREGRVPGAYLSDRYIFIPPAAPPACLLHNIARSQAQTFRPNREQNFKVQQEPSCFANHSCFLTCFIVSDAGVEPGVADRGCAAAGAAGGESVAGEDGLGRGGGQRTRSVYSSVEWLGLAKVGGGRPRVRSPPRAARGKCKQCAERGARRRYSIRMRK